MRVVIDVSYTCSQRVTFAYLSDVYFFFASDNANEKPSTVFNPAWAWLGAVVAILLVSIAVVIRKFKRARHNRTNEDDHVTQSEVVTHGYARF